MGKRTARTQAITEPRRERLNQLGFVWDPHTADWDKAFSYLKAYKEREGNCRVPYNHVENGFNLGKWVTKQRSRKKTISDERTKQLDELGFVWGERDAAWDDGFRCLQAYKKREGHCRVSKDYEENGFRLGQWISVQRHDKAFLSEPRRERLDNLGFIWNTRDELWENGFDHLRIYKQREGHCRVPGSHIENGFKLGVWVDTQRQRQKKARVAKERVRRLDELGFLWTVRS